MQVGSRIAYVCASALIVSSAGFGGLYAYKVGIEHSPLLAALSVTMALALEGLKPVAVKEAISSFASFRLIRGLLLATLALVAIAYSLTSELALVSMSKGDLSAKREDVSTLRDELRAIGITRPKGTIQADLDTVLSDRRLNGCEGWLENVKLRTTCIEKVQPLRAELAKATRREAIETRIGHGSSGSADPGSTAISHYLKALGYSLDQKEVATWLLLVPVLALELGSALALVVVPLNHPNRSTTRVEPPGPVHENQQPVTLSPMPANRQQRTRRLEPLTVDPAIQLALPAPNAASTDILVLDHLKSNGGSLLASERALANTLGMDRSTLRRTVHALANNGSLAIVQASKKGTLLRLT